jgi:hypothetical protein
MHHYRVTCAWTGSTSVGYETCTRTHTATAPPAEAELTLSADPEITVRSDDPVPGRSEVLVERVHHLCEVAHRECYIANSLTTAIVMEPTVIVVTDA